ncbi:hypothetical protein [Nocardioides xinjiangensis]|uniref:hypothetical protein n=1 Tax=Nocardioides xinjiangensis TaxID=2817376 RepID=UPI001B316985|nr:hypothetical protein [Nocardioides sp. SYSU D00514]
MDIEYSRVLMGVAEKMGPSGQIFPDLIVHHRGETDRNLLAVELKPGVPRNPTLVDKGDALKMRHLTNPGWMLGQSAYAHGVCLQLAHDCGPLHWYERGQLIEREDWTPPVL